MLISLQILLKVLTILKSGLTGIGFYILILDDNLCPVLLDDWEKKLKRNMIDHFMFDSQCVWMLILVVFFLTEKNKTE